MKFKKKQKIKEQNVIFLYECMNFYFFLLVIIDTKFEVRLQLDVHLHD